MEIRGVGQGHGPQEYQRISQQTAKEQVQKAEGEQQLRQDSVQISEEARKLLSKEGHAAQKTNAQGTADLAAGLANRLLTSGVVRNVDEAVELSRKIAGEIEQSAGQEAPKDLEEIARKIQNGFYSSPEVIDKVADNLLGELGL